MIAIGLPLAMVVFWLFPRFSAPLWGVPERAHGPSRTFRPDDAGRLDRSGRRRQPRAARQVHRRSAAAGADVLARPGAVGLRRPQLDRGGVVARSDGQRPGHAGAETLRVRTRDRTDRAQPAGGAGNAAGGPARQRNWAGISACAATSAAERHHPLADALIAADDGWKPTSTRPCADSPCACPPASTRARGRWPSTWRREAGPSSASQPTTPSSNARSPGSAPNSPTPSTLRLLGRHTVDEFLFDEKAGFCEHYSGAFVFLMRSAGIPARVVTGYVPAAIATRSATTGWCAAPTPMPGPRSGCKDRGWVRVDPTAAVAPERIYDTIDDRRPGALGDFAGLEPDVRCRRLDAPQLERLRAGLQRHAPAPAARSPSASPTWIPPGSSNCS